MSLSRLVTSIIIDVSERDGLGHLLELSLYAMALALQFKLWVSEIKTNLIITTHNLANAMCNSFLNGKLSSSLEINFKGEIQASLCDPKTYLALVI